MATGSHHAQTILQLEWMNMTECTWCNCRTFMEISALLRVEISHANDTLGSCCPKYLMSFPGFKRKVRENALCGGSVSGTPSLLQFPELKNMPICYCRHQNLPQESNTFFLSPRLPHFSPKIEDTFTGLGHPKNESNGRPVCKQQIPFATSSSC